VGTNGLHQLLLSEKRIDIPLYLIFLLIPNARFLDLTEEALFVRGSGTNFSLESPAVP